MYNVLRRDVSTEYYSKLSCIVIIIIIINYYKFFQIHIPQQVSQKYQTRKNSSYDKMTL